MKKKSTVLRAILCGILTLGTAGTFAAQLEQTDVRKALQSVVLPEMPVKAAELVKRAPASQRLAIALAVTQQAIALNPSLTVSVVSEVSRAEPSVAGDVAVIAASLQPKNLAAITHAAIKGAPSKHKQIVIALSRANPTEFPKIAGAAQMALPAEQRINVFHSLAEALPGLRPMLDEKMPTLQQMFANSGVTINVTVVEAALEVVAKQAALIRAEIIQIMKNNGISEEIANKQVSFAAVAKKILERTIPIVDANGDNAQTVTDQVAGAFTAEIQAAVNAQNEENGNTDLNTSAITSAVGNTTLGSTISNNPGFQNAQASAGQSTSIVTSGNTIILTDDDVREYSSAQ